MSKSIKSSYQEIKKELDELKRQSEDIESNNKRLDNFKTLFDSMSEMFVIKELIYDGNEHPIDCYYREVNEAFLQMVGKPREEVINKRKSDLFKITDVNLFNKYNSVIKTGEPTSFYYYIKKSNKYYQTYCWKISDNYVAVKYKVETDRARIEKEFLEIKNAFLNQDFVNNLFNGFGEPVFIKDEASRILMVNEAFCRLFHKEKEDILGKTLAEDVSIEEKELFLNVDRQIIKTGEEDVREETITFGEGDKHIIQTHKSRLTDDNGNHFLLGTIYDVTEYKKMENELRLSNQLLEDSQSLAQVGGWQLDLITKELYWTAETYKIHETTPEEFNPTVEAAMDFYLPAYEKIISEALEVAFATGKGYDLELEIYTTKGRRINVRTTCSILRKNGENVKLIGSIQDITAQKEIEHQLIKAKEKALGIANLKTEFISNMSHEIRTPMNGILGFSRMLGKPNLTENKKNQYIDIIQNSGNQLMRIVDDIVEISRLETKQIRVILKAISLNDFLFDLFSIFDKKARDSKLHLFFKKGLQSKECLIYTDESKLNKIISNLIENAIKYTEKGTIEFGYKIVENEIELYVKDTGIGVSKENQQLIFERFSKEKNDFIKDTSGLGLGLSIVKENTEVLGGRIRIESEKGKGSTFYVTVPYNPECQLEDNTSLVVDRDNEKYIILLAEDEELNYLYFEALLEELDVNSNLLHAKNGKEAVDFCKNEKIDLVFMDLKMPEMDGLEAIKLIKGFSPNLPIIAQTACVTLEDKKSAFDAGCDDFISKPLSEEVVSRMINLYGKNKHPFVA